MKFTLPRALLLCCAMAGAAAQAQIAIDQSKAMAGNITAGDAPGFPVTLSQPGPYKLMGNLTVPPGVPGVVITAPGVTLDLNGFTISGPNTCVTALCMPLPPANGINTTATNVTIRNGAVKQFAGHGIVLSGGALLENLTVRDNTNDGVYRQAVGSIPDDDNHAVLRNVQALLNGAHGFEVRDAQLVDCAALKNGGSGFRLARSSLFNSTAESNKQYGLNAVDNTLMRGNHFYFNVPQNFTNHFYSIGGNDDGTHIY